MNRKSQNLSNHVHWVPSYHFATIPAMIALIAGSVYLVVSNKQNSQLQSILFLLLVLTVISVSFHCRSFALKVQDRAIRAEENLRYFILTGKRLNQNLDIKQVIALRFASDEEFAVLVDRTIEENLSAVQIKREIKEWRSDYHRA